MWTLMLILCFEGSCVRTSMVEVSTLEECEARGKAVAAHMQNAVAGTKTSFSVVCGRQFFLPIERGQKLEYF